MASLTSQVCTLYQAREAGIAAVFALLSAADFISKHADHWEYIGITVSPGGEHGVTPSAALAQLDAAGLASLLASFTNGGASGVITRMTTPGWAARSTTEAFLTVYPDFEQILKSPVQVLEEQLFSRALTQDNPREWITGRFRTRTKKEET